MLSAQRRAEKLSILAKALKVGCFLSQWKAADRKLKADAERYTK